MLRALLTRPSHKLSLRVVATFSANVLRGGLSLATGVLLARHLGPHGYGDLSFLLGVFLALNQLLDFGVSSAFYTLVSRRRRDRRFFAWVFGWIGGQFLIVLTTIAWILPPEAISHFWVGQQRSLVLWALGANFAVTQLWSFVSQLGEASRHTVLVQTSSVVQAGAHLALVSAAVWFGWLSPNIVFALLIIENILLSLIVGPRLLRANIDAEAPAASVAEVWQEFAAYCSPLVLFSVVGFAYNFADRWLLQRFAGSQEQGYFAVGQQFANISLLATTSILRVFWKEVAEAWASGDHERVRTLGTRVQRLLFFSTAALSCLFVPFSQEILRLAVGPQYDGAALSLAIMFLYPVHQCLGQIVGTFFYGAGFTRDYVRVGLIVMVISLPVSYVALVSPHARVPGLGLGAAGLAAKMVVLQIFSVSLLGVVAGRRGGPRADFGLQAIVLTGLLVVGFLSREVAGGLITLAGLSRSVHVLAFALTGAAVYTVVVLAAVMTRPQLAGLDHQRIRTTWEAVRATLFLRPSPESKTP